MNCVPLWQSVHTSVLAPAQLLLATFARWQSFVQVFVASLYVLILTLVPEVAIVADPLTWPVCAPVSAPVPWQSRAVVRRGLSPVTYALLFPCSVCLLLVGGYTPAACRGSCCRSGSPRTR